MLLLTEAGIIAGKKEKKPVKYGQSISRRYPGVQPHSTRCPAGRLHRPGHLRVDSGDPRADVRYIPCPYLHSTNPTFTHCL